VQREPTIHSPHLVFCDGCGSVLVAAGLDHLTSRSVGRGSTNPIGTGISVWVALFVAVAASAAAQVPRPNILFILADDLGYGELGCYGQRIIQTPNLDRLAAEGMRFTQFYAGSTVCAPSRSVLMTGLHTGHTRVRGNAGPDNTAAQTLRAIDVTVARVLQRSGYATALIGKWGLGLSGEEGEPFRQGFDYFFGFLSQTHAHNYYPDFLWRNQERVALANVVTHVGPTGAGYATKRVQYAGDLFFEEARMFIERNSAKPFFLELALTTPHANNERARALGDGQEVPDYGPYADKDWSDAVKGQAAMITRMDGQVGELCAQLKRLDLDRHTIVIFTSDNGPHAEGGVRYDPDFFAPSGRFRGRKRNLTEGGLRVPFIVKWSGSVKAGTLSSHVSYFGDMMATFGEIAGASPPKDLDSISLVPTLLGRGTQRKHAYLYWEFYEGGVSQAVLLGSRFKGIRLQRVTAPIQLYDLANDVAEQTDVAASNPDITASNPDITKHVADIMRQAHVDNEHWRFNGAAGP